MTTDKELTSLKLPVAVKRRFTAFMESIPKIKWYRPDGRPNPEWKMFYGKTWGTAQDGAWDDAWNGARAAAWKDGVYDAVWNAAGSAVQGAAGNAARGAARVAAWNSARAATRNAARDAARNGAGNSAWDAAWDAALMASIIVVGDLDYPKKQIYERHVASRMNVWKKGYGLLCDVNGVLYVYVQVD